MPTQAPNITNDLLTRSVTNVVPQELAEAKLKSGKKLRIYFGIDPTGDKLHLGHAVPLRKLRSFQEAGHEIILVIGSFTAMIGDPSGRESAREPLKEQQVKKNFATYKKQASKVLDLNKVRVEFNHEWLGKLKFKDVVELASKFTVQQMLAREMYRKNIAMVKCRNCGEAFKSPIQFPKRGGVTLVNNRTNCPHCGTITILENKDIFHLDDAPRPIGLNEFLYPLMVAYDSFHLDVDCEIGGNDQLFNMLCGRTLQQAYKKRDKFVLTTKLLEGTDGRKMSKTYNNAIYLTDNHKEMYGKVMSIKDELIVPYFELCTALPIEEIKEIENSLKKADNPKTYKVRLAKEIVSLYYPPTPSEGDKDLDIYISPSPSPSPSDEAAEEFERVHREKQLPTDIPNVKIPPGKDAMFIVDLLVYAKLAPSKSVAERLVEQGGVKIEGKVIKDWRYAPVLRSGLIIQVGPRKFVRLV